MVASTFAVYFRSAFATSFAGPPRLKDLLTNISNHSGTAFTEKTNLSFAIGNLSLAISEMINSNARHHPMIVSSLALVPEQAKAWRVNRSLWWSRPARRFGDEFRSTNYHAACFEHALKCVWATPKWNATGTKFAPYRA
jgi:hypothetical protein